MQIKKLAILSILALSLFTGCNDDKNINEDVVATTKPQVEQLPTFHLKTTTGKDITIEVTKDGWNFKEYPNKAVLLTFFATWCPPCKAEIPHLINLQKKHSKDFQVIAVVVERDKSNKSLNTFIKNHNITYPITNSQENFNLAGAVGGVSSIPAMFLFNKKGLVVQNYVGAVHEEILESDITKAIGK